MANPVFSDLFASKEDEYDIAEGYLGPTAIIESGMNPNARARTSSAGGMFQFIDGTANQYGLRNRFDPVESTDAAARLARDNADLLRRRLGREPTREELYVAHQQGAGGAANLLTNPDVPAHQVVGMRAVTNNGGDDATTAGDLTGKWMSKFQNVAERGNGGYRTDAAQEEFQRREMADMPAPGAMAAMGGMGGLGGFAVPPRPVREPTFADNAGSWLGALGKSLMSSPRNAPLAGMPAALDQQEQMRARQMESARSQANQDRSFGLQERQVSDQIANRNLTNDVREYEYAKKQGFEGTFVDFQKQLATNKAGATRFGVQPVPLEGGGYGVIGSDGSIKRLEGPAGGAGIATKPKQVRTATEIIDYDPITLQEIKRTPLDLAGAARQKEEGEAAGKAVAGAPAQIAGADAALKVLDQIERHPARTSATGWQANVPTVKGTPVYDFENLVEQAKGGAFLTAIQQMRGLGALTEKEGTAATAAVNRMNIATSDAGFLKAVQDYREIVQQGKAKAEAFVRPGGGPTAPSGGGRPAAGGPGAGAVPFAPADVLDRRTVGSKTFVRTRDGRTFEVAQ